MLRTAAILTLALTAAGCTAETSRRCRDVCARQAKCAEEARTDDANFDEGECVAACAALERDKETVGLVESHAECVAQASSCSAVLTCR